MIEKSPAQLLVYKSVTFGAWFIAGYFATIYSLLYKHPIGIAISSILMFIGLFLFATHMLMDFVLSINLSLRQTLYEYNLDITEEVNEQVMLTNMHNQLQNQNAFIQHMLEHGGRNNENGPFMGDND